MWSSERICTDGDEYFAALVADIDAATRSVDLETYILEDDEIGRLVVDALTRARDRGLAVRLLVDGVGAYGWLAAVGRRFRGCPWRVYHPMPWLLVGTDLPTAHALQSRLSAFTLGNRRNHRKTCVIDETVAWVGSFNLERRHARAAVGDRVWRDTAARVEGPAVEFLTRAFQHTWKQSWRFGAHLLLPSIDLRGRGPKVDPSQPVRLNGRRSLRRRLWRDLLLRIARARERVWITTPYFVPTEDLLKALEIAARTADVRLLLPAVNDVYFMPWIASVYAPRLRAAGIRLWSYPRMIHAKTQVIDGVGLVGSSNLNSRSLFFDLEADVWVGRPESVQALADAFEADCGCAAEVPGDARPARWRCWLGSAALVARRWM